MVGPLVLRLWFNPLVHSVGTGLQRYSMAMTTSLDLITA